MMNREMNFMQGTRGQGTWRIFWSVSVLACSLVVWCSQSSAGGWRPDTVYDAIFMHPGVTQTWRHNGEPTGIAGVDSHWCVNVGECCEGVGGVPWGSSPGDIDANITRITGRSDTAIVIDGSSQEIRAWSFGDGLLGKAVDSGGNPVTGFTFAELGDIDGDDKTDLFCLVGNTDLGWYEYNPTTGNFEVVDVVTGSGFVHGTVGYLSSSAPNHCLISVGNGVQGLQEFPPGTGELVVTASYPNLTDLANQQGTWWTVLSLGNVDYDDMPDLLLLGANGRIYWTEWDGNSDFTLQASLIDPEGGSYTDVAVGSDILDDEIGDIFAIATSFDGRVQWILNDGGNGLFVQEVICGSGYVKVAPERDDNLRSLAAPTPTPTPTPEPTPEPTPTPTPEPTPVPTQTPVPTNTKLLEDDFGDPAGNMEITGDPLDIPDTATWFLSSGNMFPNYDGVSTLRMPQQGAWHPNIESQGTSSGIAYMRDGHEHAFICIFTMPDTGMMTFGLASENVGFSGPSQRYFRVIGGDRRVLMTQNPTWGAPPSSLGPYTGQQIKTNVPQGLMMRIGDSEFENVTLYYQDGGDKDASSEHWKEITGLPRTDPLMSMDLDGVWIVVGHPPSDDDPAEDFLLDYVALIQDPPAVFIPPPNDVDMNWLLY